VIGKALTTLPIVAPGIGVATGLAIEIAVEIVVVTEIAIGTETGIETETATVAGIATVTGIASETGIVTEIGIATASTKARGFTTLRTMATTVTVPMPMNGAIRMACIPAPVMGDEVKAMIRIVHTSTGMATLVSSRSSAAATRTSRPTEMVFCAATRKATKTGKDTSSAAVFIDSSMASIVSQIVKPELVGDHHSTCHKPLATSSL
jgi:hypothetical protein